MADCDDSTSSFKLFKIEREDVKSIPRIKTNDSTKELSERLNYLCGLMDKMACQKINLIVINFLLNSTWIKFFSKY